MPWRPSEPGEYPTLGWHVLDWMSAMLAAPDRTAYEPFVPTPEQAHFVLRLYELDPKTGRRKRRRAVISRPKGWGKSPILSAIGAAEALTDVVSDGWDANGQPVGRPWSTIRTPWVQYLAVSEDQTRNAWAPLLEMLREGPVIDEYPGLEPMESFVALPKGRIEAVTAAATSREGNRPVAAFLDQTESWFPSNGGVKLAATVRRNLGKTGGVSIEAPNAFVPGLNSVAEASAEYAKRIIEGRARDEGLLYDHREWPPETDMTDRASLLHGLAIAYGDSAEVNGGWVDLDRIVAEIWDPATEAQDARLYYGNQVTHAADSWLSQPEWAACRHEDGRDVKDGDTITLGFDGSSGRRKGKADATALIGVRVSDGHEFEVGVWEEPDDWKPPADDLHAVWQPPEHEVDGAVHQAHKRWRVVAFYGDPTGWDGHMAAWEAKYGAKYAVKATQQHPIRWPKNQMNRVVEALRRHHDAIVNREMSHDGSLALARHYLNARRRITRSGVFITKAHPDSPNKIDAAYAGTLAWQARLDAVAAGVTTKRTGTVGRIR